MIRSRSELLSLHFMLGLIHGHKLRKKDLRLSPYQTKHKIVTETVKFKSGLSLHIKLSIEDQSDLGLFGKHDSLLRLLARVAFCYGSILFDTLFFSKDLTL